jgi:regulator of cell morphogenesis and NO signaling
VIAPDQPVAQIVLEHPRCAGILVDRDVDFCCRGPVSLADACAKRGIDVAALVAELEAAVAGELPGGPGLDPRSLTTLQLVARIVDQHHVYLRKTLPLVELLAGRVVEAHAERQPSLEELQSVLRAMRALLEPHLQHEEAVLFPLLIGRARSRQRIRAELDWMRAEHLQVGDALRELRTLSNRFVPPAWACATYRALLSELEAMDRDTLEHVHLENNVLAARFERAQRVASGVQRGRVR